VSESDQPQSGSEEVRLPSVPEVLLSTVQLLVTLAAEAIDRRERLEEAQLAIDTLGALLPQVQRVVPPDAVGPFRDVLSELQLAYVHALEAPAPASQEQEHPSEPVVETPPRPKIWTPEGEV
jgi:hypothetical protein